MQKSGLPFSSKRMATSCRNFVAFGLSFVSIRFAEQLVKFIWGKHLFMEVSQQSVWGG